MDTNGYFYERFSGKGNIVEYVTDKEKSAKTYIKYMTIRLQKMFEYKNLPDSIPREILEYYLLMNGSCFIAKHNDKLYAFTGSMGGEPDEYYRPTKYIVANPALNLSKEYEIGTDGILMRNDELWLGLYPLMASYATLLSENTLTIRVADIMLRILSMLTAPDDKTKIAAEEYLRKLENGSLGVISENRFFDGVKLQSPPSNNGSYLTQFIELHQYLKGSFYNEIGLNANFNMKREAIGDGESSLNEDSLLPLCEHMLRCRKEDIKKVNDMFGTNIEVEFDSAWFNNQKEIELELEVLENEASQLVENNEESEEIEENKEEINIEESEVIDSNVNEENKESEDSNGNSEDSDNISDDE